MKIKSALDHQIDATREQMNQAENRAHELNKQVKYLELQEEVCIEKYSLYKEKNDLVKQLYWEELMDYCESSYLKLREEREASHKEEYRLRDELIQLLNRSIGELLQPFREHEYEQQQKIYNHANHH